jgi:hypothetical protein
MLVYNTYQISHTSLFWIPQSFRCKSVCSLKTHFLTVLWTCGVTYMNVFKLTVEIFTITKICCFLHSSVVSQSVQSIYFISDILLLLLMSLLHISTLWKHELACSFHVSLVKYRQFIWQVSFNIKQKKNILKSDTQLALT